jgi:hypothetical protein
MQRKSPTPRESPGLKPGLRRSTAWHAVSVVAGPSCCEAARALPPTRYLSREAPRLPLPDCTSPACSCSYKHYVDRRGQPRRKEDLSGFRRGQHSGTERRAMHGRREDD